jgi:chloramphenicol-sensitive protein RarD
MSANPSNQDTASGFAFALSAYLLWGFLPLYMKLLSHIPPTEIVAHRVIWSVPLAGAVLMVLRRTGDILPALRSPKTLAMGIVMAALISINWGIYVYAVTTGQALEAALGYYINPLFSVFLGAVILRERLNPMQWVAIGLAGLAVCVLTYDAGRLPLTALGLTLTWGIYAFFKKQLPIGPNQGFLLEVLILLIPALAYWVWLGGTGKSAFGLNLRDTLLLLGCGVVTAVPLLLYANGAKGLRLTTIGIMQYIAPTLIMLVAVFVFGEPFGSARAIAFPLIWLALVLYTTSMLRGRRIARAGRS